MRNIKKGDDQVIEKSKGYRSLMEAVKHDAAGGEDCFNPKGCTHAKGHSKCFHPYCDKFAWVLKRVKHYSEKTRLTEPEILDSWEEKRDYWYLNYYQDARQPLIKGDRVRVVGTRLEFKESLKDKGFRCPYCGHESKNPQECDSDDCDWKSYGLLGTLGKGSTVFIKETLEMAEIFRPVAWETS